MVRGTGAVGFAFLLVLLVIVCDGFVRAEAVEMINYKGIVSKVVGTPFGINATVGATQVSGSFKYDLNTSPVSDNVINVANFEISIASGFTLNINGGMLSSSNYIIQNINDVLNFDGSDIFRAVADSDIGPITFNGLPVLGSYEAHFVDLDMTLFQTNASVSILLPPLQIINETNLMFGVLGQDGENFIEFQMELDSKVIAVNIDIKPGDDSNCVNNDGHGVIPVAVLGSGDFDVTEIDPGTVQLAGLAVKVVGKNQKLLAHIEDVNSDDFPDLVVQIQDSDGAFSSGTTTATLTGKLFGGTPIEGIDTLCVVP